MPNWCANRVYIEASPSEIEAIIEAVQSDGDSDLLNYLCPQPEHVEESEDNPMSGWYSWRVDNWGTKWEVQAEIVSDSIADGWINLAFYSAWAPPIAALEHWGSNGEDRSFNIRYIEWGMGFCGEADNRGINEHYDIPATVADVQALIPVDIDEEFGISDNVAQWEGEEAETEAV